MYIHRAHGHVVLLQPHSFSTEYLERFFRKRKVQLSLACLLCFLIKGLDLCFWSQMGVIRWRIAFSLCLSKYVLQYTNFSRAVGWDGQSLLEDGCWPSGQADFNLHNTAGPRRLFRPGHTISTNQKPPTAQLHPPITLQDMAMQLTRHYCCPDFGILNWEIKLHLNLGWLAEVKKPCCLTSVSFQLHYLAEIKRQYLPFKFWLHTLCPPFRTRCLKGTWKTDPNYANCLRRKWWAIVYPGTADCIGSAVSCLL